MHHFNEIIKGLLTFNCSQSQLPLKSKIDENSKNTLTLKKRFVLLKSDFNALSEQPLTKKKLCNVQIQKVSR